MPKALSNKQEGQLPGTSANQYKQVGPVDAKPTYNRSLIPHRQNKIILMRTDQQAVPQLLVQADLGNAIINPLLCNCRIT